MPFLRKVEKGWDTEVYDKAAGIMYCFLREIALPVPGARPSDEIVVSIRLKPYDFSMSLFSAMYALERRKTFKARKRRLRLPYRQSIFPELQKTPDYQRLEKAWKAKEEKQRQEFKTLEQDPIKYFLNQAKQAENRKP